MDNEFGESADDDPLCEEVTKDIPIPDASSDIIIVDKDSESK